MRIKSQILRTINRKWEDPELAPNLLELADELLEKIEPDDARAAKELLDELGVKPEDIER